MKKSSFKKMSVFLILIMIFSIVAPDITVMAQNSTANSLELKKFEEIVVPTEDNTLEIIDDSEPSEDLIVPNITLKEDELPKKLGGILDTLEKVNQELEPASLDCTYKLKQQVLTLKEGELSGLLELSSGSEVMDKLPSQEKINRGLMVQKKVLEQHLPTVDQSTIVYDEVNNLTAKLDPMNIDGTSAGMRISRPQIAELVDDISINPTHKKIQLNKANLKYSNQNKTTLKGLISNSKPASSSGGMQVMSGGLPTSMALIDVTIPDNTEFEAVSSDGATVKVRLSGYFKIRGIDVSASYSFMSGYDITLSTGVDVKIDAKFTASHGVVAVPLYGIDIPAGVANVSGGIFLVIDNNGDFSLAINAESHIGASASIYGGTFFGVPTSVHTGFKPEFKFSADVPALAGKCKGTITVGPYLNLNVFGFDIVSANVGIGAGIDTNQVTLENGKTKFLDCNVYGCLVANASAFSEGVCLADLRLPLYSFRTEDTGGYKLNFYEVDAYTKHVSGKLEFNNGGLEPVGVKNGSFYLIVKRANTKNPAFKKMLIKTNEKGEFDSDVQQRMLSGKVVSQELYAGDEVTIADIYNPDKNPDKNARDNPTFKIVKPTIPFKEPVLEYADFFNNTIKGNIAPAFKKNIVTGVEKIVYFNGKIELMMEEVLKIKVFSDAINSGTNNGIPKPMENIPTIQVPAKLGEFFIRRDNVSPQLVVQPILRYNDFVLVGSSRQADTDLVGTRLVLDEKWVRIKEHQYDYSCKELFYIRNMRDKKQVDTLGTYKPISFMNFKNENSFMYISIVQVNEKKNFYRIVKPVQANETIDFQVPKLNTDGNGLTLGEVFQAVKDQETGGTSLVETYFHYLTTNNENKEYYKPSGSGKGDVIKFSTKPVKGSEKLKEINWGGMLGKVVVTIKGVQVVISDKNDIVPEEENVSRGKSLDTVGDNLINEKIWSRINPNPVEKVGINLYVPDAKQK